MVWAATLTSGPTPKHKGTRCGVAGWRADENAHTVLAMSSLRRPGILAWTRRCTAALMVVVQLVAVLASFTEVGEAPGGWHAAPDRRASGESVAPSSSGGQDTRHNEATCPACIVRSLHARLEAPAPLPFSVSEEPDSVAPSPASLPRTNPSFGNLSRAPPIVG